MKKIVRTHKRAQTYHWARKKLTLGSRVPYGTGQLMAKMTDRRPDHGKAASVFPMVVMDPIGFILTIQWAE